MLIKNASWLDISNSVLRGNILVKNCRIADISPEVNNSWQFSSTIDASDKLLMPGCIDPHVHFRQPGQFYKEGIKNGSRAALYGGVTTVLDMPNNKPPCNNGEVFCIKNKLFQKYSLVNWGLHVLPGNYKNAKYASIKIFFSAAGGSKVVKSANELAELFENYNRFTFHVEDEDYFLSQENCPHHEKRPRTAILSGLSRIEHALKIFSEKNPSSPLPEIILLHVSTIEELDWLSKMRKKGVSVAAETAPHYLFFTQDDVMKSFGMLQVNPPIREETDRLALLAAINDGSIQFIGSDHAPHSPEEKQSPAPPSGVPGIESFGSLLLKLYEEKLIGISKLIELACSNSAKHYSIKDRDGIKIGNFADLVLYKKTIPGDKSATIVTKAGYNPWQKFSFPWKVDTAIVNGTVSLCKEKWLNFNNSKEVYENCQSL
ncbi:MAG: amidohydrolase family protein [Candidatus Riflebacteria bacterium]|nr:amidohydrolase family protein [Candidatus Riflebacteria bacterium]